MLLLEGSISGVDNTQVCPSSVRGECVGSKAMLVEARERAQQSFETRCSSIRLHVGFYVESLVQAIGQTQLMKKRLSCNRKLDFSNNALPS